MKLILSIGDSHSKFWNNYHDSDIKGGAFFGVDCLHLGPACAFKLPCQDASLQADRRIHDFLHANQDTYRVVILSFGTLDCEYYVVRQALFDDTSIDEKVREFAEIYVAFVSDMCKHYGLKCLIYGPPPVSKRSLSKDTVVFGSVEERNHAIDLRNRDLSVLCLARNDLAHFSIAKHVVDDFGIVKPDFYGDGIHLSIKALDAGEKEVRKTLDRIGILGDYKSALKRSNPINKNSSLRNVAVGLSPLVSSSWEWHPVLPFFEHTGPEFVFHTDLDDAPSILIDLEAIHLVSKIKVHNRAPGCERASSLAVAIVINGKDFTNVFAPTPRTIFGLDDDYLRIDFPDKTLCRFVKLYLREKNYFHLKNVEVLANSFHRVP